MYAVNVEADTCPTATDGNSIVVHTVKTDVRILGCIEVGSPFRAGIVSAAYSDKTPLRNLYVDIGCRILRARIQ